MRTTLGALAESGGIQTGPFGSQLHAHEYSEVGVPVVMPQDLGDNSISIESIARVPEEVAERLSRHRLRAGDVVYSRRGDITKRAWVFSEQDGWLCGTGCLRVRLDPALADSRFVSYALGLAETRTWLMNHAVGATMPNLNTAILSAVPVDLPDLATQTAIAEVLGSLDDKIAANERLRRAVGEWSAALFSAVTKGAVVTRLGDCAVINARTLKPGSGQIRYLDIAAVGVGEFSEPTEMEWDDAPSRARRGVQEGDVIWSTVRPERRSHALILNPPDGLVCSTGLVTLTPTTVGSAFLYEATRTQQFVDFLVAGSTGSAYPAANAAVFLEAPVSLPDPSLLGQFEAQAGPAWQRVAAADEETRRLAAARDALLPELMSGRLTVDEVKGRVP